MTWFQMPDRGLLHRLVVFEHLYFLAFETTVGRDAAHPLNHNLQVNGRRLSMRQSPDNVVEQHKVC